VKKLGIVLACALWVANTHADIIMVRHAEKLSGKDPELTACGKLRAQHLIDELQHLNVVAVYSTNYQRTTQTAMPLAHHLGLELTFYQPGELSKLAAGLQQIIGDVVVIGHSNTTPELAELLVGHAVEPIAHHQYDRLYSYRSEGVLEVSLQAFQCPL